MSGRAADWAILQSGLDNGSRKRTLHLLCTKSTLIDRPADVVRANRFRCMTDRTHNFYQNAPYAPLYLREQSEMMEVFVRCEGR
jgi:hypothetical protein